MQCICCDVAHLANFANLSTTNHNRALDFRYAGVAKKKGTIVVSTIKIDIKMYLYFSYLILNHLKYGQNPPKQLFCIWTRLAFLKKIFIKISNSYICLQITYTAFVFSPRSMTYKSVAMFNWGVCYI